ncbi:MAG: LssY C-terminal domain-containing protein [Halioglobus sp.]
MRNRIDRIVGGSDRTLRFIAVAALSLCLAACASRPYQAAGPDAVAFTQRALVQQKGNLTVSASVPTAEETKALTGLDLYSQGIQPVWLEIENRAESPARLITWSIDRDYYSPIEVAYMNRKPFSKEGYEDMQAWFYNNGMPRQIPASGKAAGLVFTHLRAGTKGFNLNLIQQGEAYDFTFFVPLPGFQADYTRVNFGSLYSPEERVDLDLAGLREKLETDLSCCATDETKTKEGAPFNVIMVGSAQAVRRAMLRGAWLETSAETGAKARKQRFDDRPPDAVFWKYREDGNERIALHFWMTPWNVKGEPVWVSQAYYFSDDATHLSLFAEKLEENTEIGKLFARESVTADSDSAQKFLLQNLWYNGSLEYAGYVNGVGEVSIENPRTTFGGATYFTDGHRLVVFLSEDIRALDEMKFVYDTRSRDYSGIEPIFEGRQVPPPNNRLHTQNEGELAVVTAVPSKEETKAIFGMDLYKKGVQPVWVQVENRGESALYLTPMGMDRSYFTPREAANRSRVELRPGHAQHFETRSHVRLAVAPGSIQSGYIFSRVDEGTKSFNVDVIGDGEVYLMTFFVPVPGLKLDHYEVDVASIYPAEEVRDVNLSELVAELEAMPCCVHDAAGKDKGDPLNLVFIGEPRDLYYSFMRAGWDETETIYTASLLKTATSALTGGRYRYSPVSALYVFDRPQDAAMQRARSSINERNHLRVWMTPLRHEGKPVWIGQISRDIGVRFTRKTITTHKIDPNVDETREFLLEDLAYSQAVKAFGYMGGVGAADYDSPRGNLTGDPYFTDGRRLLLWLSGEPIGLDEVEVLDLSPYSSRLGASN